MAKVLVVDDSMITRIQLQDSLKQAGITSEVVGDGVAALEAVESDPEIELVVSDVHMPHMDGLAFVTKLRSQYADRAIKVIMLTTEDSTILKERASDLNIIGWVVKPMNPSLGKLIAKVLSK